MRNLKIAPQLEPVDGRAVVALLNRRLAELSKRRDEITQEIIALEKTTAWRETDDNGASRQAAEMLDGGKFLAPPAAPLSRIAALFAERDTIDLALRIGGDRHARAAAEAAGDVYAAHFAEITTLERRRVLLALELQSVNRSRERLREKLDGAGCPGCVMSTDSVDLLGLGDVHDEIAWAGNRLIADGIATKREIEKARSDG